MGCHQYCDLSPEWVAIKDNTLAIIAIMPTFIGRENIDLGKFLEEGITKGVDSLPKEEFDKVQKLFL